MREKKNKSRAAKIDFGKNQEQSKKNVPRNSRLQKTKQKNSKRPQIHHDNRKKAAQNSRAQKYQQKTQDGETGLRKRTRTKENAGTNTKNRPKRIHESKKPEQIQKTKNQPDRLKIDQDDRKKAEQNSRTTKNKSTRAKTI